MASLSSYALTNLADVKETAGIASGDTSWDNLIIRKINQSTEMIEGWCNRRFLATDYVEYYDSTYSEQLILRQYPVINLTTIEARDTTLNDSSFNTVVSDMYFTDTNAGIIDAVSQFWGKYDQWRVTYRAGYATIPYDLAEACATLASYLAVNDPSQTAGIARKREGAREIQYGNARFVTPDTSGAEVLFTELGILPTLQRYSSQALGSLR